MNRLSEYGPGDPQTWGPITSAADPRYYDSSEDRADRAQEMADARITEPKRVKEAVSELLATEELGEEISAVILGDASPLTNRVHAYLYAEAMREIEQNDEEEKPMRLRKRGLL